MKFLPKEGTLQLVIAGIPNKYKPFCKLLLEAGLTSLEAWQLKWSSINFKTGHFNVTPTKKP